MERRRLGYAAGLAVLGWACASVPVPREQLAKAEDAVTRAEQEGAGQYAPLPLRKAEDELERAKEALGEERNVEARRAAERAEAEADLATATAQRERSQALVAELARTVNALEEDTR